MRASELSRRHDSLSNAEVAAILHEVCARIGTVGQLHRFLTTQPHSARIELSQHLQELCGTLVEALAAPGQLELIETASDDCIVRTDHVMPLSLIVTEIVTNSIKYAHPAGAPGRLMVGCRRAPGGGVVIEIADDGVGLPENCDLAASGGIGSRTIRVLAKQLDAELSFTSGPIGLAFELQLPPEI